MWSENVSIAFTQWTFYFEHMEIIVWMTCVFYRDKSRNSARITCTVCLEDYQTTINFLSEPIDVYNDWVDACEAAN